ncbi:hypothetical protein VOLCADRAFT_104079 [Volvox carteri f. nagariensis]|uniref:SET domain-containing protein n=1 Tax=Volvox carteri f. nagariensis TaxID=3068 RepID=D8TR31_VOLCA|nr:uncharacterized protein VOLCADRAFT_104079 [Volvox carteri f. nagariensis]EFJ50130.1 hypothetical protein VOLCADRAFT_104079 [Volvox carteri f. nagariensis]|eukprot:XP_002948750.1 hypothetical protein VOLCADRAFT_104079 [Volvox carteri f. nagariensis]
MAFDPEDESEQAAASAQQDLENEQEIALMPCYQMYTDAGYKAQRFVGSLKIDQPQGEPLPVLCTTRAMLPGELALVLPAVAMAEGGFQQVPELEDLHAILLEDGPSPPQRRVLSLLESLRPGPTSPCPSTPSPSSSATSGPSSTPNNPEDPPASPTAAATEAKASTASPQPPQTLPHLSTLDVKFWSSRGRDTAAAGIDSRRLLRLLSRTAIADDSQDPAAMQARHQKPMGYVGLWPEAALMGHSCVPNTSQLVVADRMFVHLAEELPPGASLTRNLIGAAVTAPLDVRQNAVAEAMAEQGVAVGAAVAELPSSSLSPLLHACHCARCQLEASVSEQLRDTLAEAHAWYVNEASEAWNRANESEDLALLRGLLEECETIVAEVEEAVQAEPGLDDEQQDWLRASAYDVYDMLVTLDELVNQDSADPDILRTCLELIRVHSPGSGSHLMVALKHEALRRHRLEVFSDILKRDRGAARKAISKGDKRKLVALKTAADVATEFRIEAAVLRYGLVTEDILAQLTEGLETYVEGLEQLSVMQAQGMTELTREMEVDGIKVQIVDRLEVSEAARAGPGAKVVSSKDGVQLMVVEDAGAAMEMSGLGGGMVESWQAEDEVEEEGAAELMDGEEEEGEIIDLEVDPDLDFDVDSAVQAAVDAALAGGLVENESEDVEGKDGLQGRPGTVVVTPSR